MTESTGKFRLLAIFPVVFALGLGAVAFGVRGAAVTSVLTAANEAGKVLAVVGCFAAAFAFDPGDYLRRAWSLSGGCYLLLLAGDAVGAPSLAGKLSIHEVGLTQGALALLANAASVVGTWMLARAWTVAGLEDDDSSRVRGRLLFAGAALVSLAITGWPLVHDLRAFAAGDFAASVSIASDLGDTICLALVAPVLQTALAMRGGVLRWPCGLLTAGGLAWIAFDAASGAADALRAPQSGWLIATEGWRALACAAFFSAGLAQRWVVAPAPAPAPV